MSKPIYVFGHLNPDTDSICSAISYANLKQKLGYTDVRAARLGDVSKETQFALDYFDIVVPEILDSVKPVVSDLNLQPVECLRKDDTLKSALGKIIKQKGHVLPVVNEEGKFIGVLSISDIAPAYMGLAGKSLLKITETPKRNVVDVLHAKIVMGEEQLNGTVGNIYTVAEKNKLVQLDEEDVIISNYDRESLDFLFSCGSKFIIFADSISEANQMDIPEDFDGIVLAVQYTIFEVIKLISQTMPIKTMIKNNMLEYVQLEDDLDEVKELMSSSKHRRFPVVDAHGSVRAMISRSSVLNINRRKVILVDHNEKFQSVKGIEDAEITEIIDHHRVANVSTMAPLYFRAEPLGCTSSIIFKMYKEYDIEIDEKIAGIMLSAILSDTLVFNSPTCTDFDRVAAIKLATIANVDLYEYGMKMLVAGTSIEGESAKNILNRDKKHFTLGKYSITVSQINTADLSSIRTIQEELLGEMKTVCAEEELDLAVLMVTDIVGGGTELILTGKERWIAENAFDIEKGTDSKFLKGVFSRKKQVVPVLMNAAKL